MGLWLANLSNFILCFTYFKAVINTLLVKLHFKKASGFKVRHLAHGSCTLMNDDQLDSLSLVPDLGSVTPCMHTTQRCMP
jgi:hypothetical protein